MTTALAEQFGLPRPVGVAVTDVYPDAPAANAGIRVGDELLEIDGNSLDDLEETLRPALDESWRGYATYYVGSQLAGAVGSEVVLRLADVERHHSAEPILRVHNFFEQGMVAMRTQSRIDNAQAISE